MTHKEILTQAITNIAKEFSEESDRLADTGLDVGGMGAQANTVLLRELLRSQSRTCDLISRLLAVLTTTL